MSKPAARSGAQTDAALLETSQHGMKESQDLIRGVLIEGEQKLHSELRACGQHLEIVFCAFGGHSLGSINADSVADPGHWHSLAGSVKDSQQAHSVVAKQEMNVWEFFFDASYVRPKVSLQAREKAAGRSCN